MTGRTSFINAIKQYLFCCISYVLHQPCAAFRHCVAFCRSFHGPKHISYNHEVLHSVSLSTSKEPNKRRDGRDVNDYKRRPGNLSFQSIRLQKEKNKIHSKEWNNFFKTGLKKNNECKKTEEEPPVRVARSGLGNSWRFEGTAFRRVRVWGGEEKDHSRL